MGKTTFKSKKLKWISIFILILIFVGVFLVFKRSNLVKNTDIIEVLDYEDSATVSGVVVRQEKTILCDNNLNFTNCLIKDGEKVNLHNVIFDVFFDKNNFVLNNKLVNINKEIEILKKCLTYSIDPNCDFEPFNKSVFKEIINLNSHSVNQNFYNSKKKTALFNFNA